MRRIGAVFIALALCAAGASLVALGTPCMRHTLRNPVFESIAGRVQALRVLAGLRRLGPGVVSAAETLRFRPLPPESADLVTRRRARSATPVVPPPPEPPSTPEPPASPEPPEPPQIVKSGDIMRVGSDIHVGKDEVVRGSVSAIGGDVTVDGHVEGDVSAIRGDVYLGSTARVDGDVVSAGGQIHEEPGATVSGQRVTAIPGSRVKRIHRHMVDDTGDHVGGIVATMIWLIIWLGVGWAIAQLAPARTVAAIETLQRAPMLSVGIGALILALIIPSVIALSLVVAFLCITIIGIPLALAALVGYGLFFVVFGVWGYVVGAGAIGAAINQRRRATTPAPAGTAAPAVIAGTHGPPTVASSVLTGILVMTGSLVVGSLFGGSMIPAPFRVLGGFLFVIAIIMMGLSALAGGGAWLRSEFQTGTLGRWWQGRKLRSTVTVPPRPPVMAAAPPPPSPPSAYAPPPSPPSPPSAYAPPPVDPQAPPTG